VTKVVIQSRDYWLRDEFWQEAAESGVEPTLVEVKNGVASSRPITRAEFAARFAGRIANWVTSADKSVSVFRDALTPEQRKTVTRLFREALRVGLETVGREFTARTGAQGKVRLPADISFAVIIHTHAKDGSPQLHAHVAVDDRVRVRGAEKTYATHKRELYQLRKLFQAAAAHDFGHRLLAEFGVPVQKTEHGVALPDVPKELCRRSSARTKQIDEYIRKHALKNTPLTRKYAAVVTRRENRDPTIGRDAFRAELARAGFRPEQICRRVTPDQFVDVNRPSAAKEIRRVGREAQRLSKQQSSVTRNELLTKALETAQPHHPVSRVALATDIVLRSPKAVGLSLQNDAHGRPVYVPHRSAERWKKVARKIEFILRAKEPPSEPRREPARPEQAHEGKPKQDGATASQQSARPNDQRPNADRAAERSTDLRRVVEKVLRSYRVVGAVGHLGVKAVEIAVELYQTWAKPVWRVHGNGHKNTPGSVAKMVRDLKPLSVIDSHKAAIGAMLKLNGTLDQKLAYGQFVYRAARKAKFRIPRKSLIVVRDVGHADPKDVAFLLRKAGRAKAKTIFVDREHSRFSLLRAAKSMRPGEHKHFPGPDLKP
jgi:hypothetical protein